MQDGVSTMGGSLKIHVSKTTPTTTDHVGRSMKTMLDMR